MQKLISVIVEEQWAGDEDSLKTQTASGVLTVSARARLEQPWGSQAGEDERVWSRTKGWLVEGRREVRGKGLIPGEVDYQRWKRAVYDIQGKEGPGLGGLAGNHWKILHAE